MLSKCWKELRKCSQTINKTYAFRFYFSPFHSTYTGPQCIKANLVPCFCLACLFFHPSFQKIANLFTVFWHINKHAYIHAGRVGKVPLFRIILALLMEKLWHLVRPFRAPDGFQSQGKYWSKSVSSALGNLSLFLANNMSLQLYFVELVKKKH